MTEFKISFEGVELSPEQVERIDRAIQGAALQELAKINITTDIFVHIPRKEWYGIWIGPAGGLRPRLDRLED